MGDSKNKESDEEIVHAVVERPELSVVTLRRIQLNMHAANEPWSAKRSVVNKHLLYNRTENGSPVYIYGSRESRITARVTKPFTVTYNRPKS